MAIADRPRPAPTPLTEPYWKAARKRRLDIQRCSSCRRYYHPPVPQCPECHSLELVWESVSGEGTIYQRTIVYASRVAGFLGQPPYAVIAVELDEQPGLLVITNLIDADTTQAVVGARVSLTFETLAEGTLLPQFRLA